MDYRRESPTVDDSSRSCKSVFRIEHVVHENRNSVADANAQDWNFCAQICVTAVVKNDYNIKLRPRSMISGIYHVI